MADINEELPNFDREPLPSEEEEKGMKMIDYYLRQLLVEEPKEKKENE